MAETAERNVYNKQDADSYVAIYDFVGQVELPSFLSLVQKTSNLEAANILDAGCGPGRYPRHFRKMTTGAVYGVDISDGMLEKAESLNEKDAKVIYKKVDLVADSICSVLEVREGFFDIAICIWALCHAQTVADLKKMVGNIAKCIKPGGKFYGITFNPDLTQEDFDKEMKYFYTHIPADKTKKLSNEDKFFYTLFDPQTGEKILEVPDYYYDRETMERVFREEGFKIEKMDCLRELSPNPEVFQDINPGIFFDLTKI